MATCFIGVILLAQETNKAPAVKPGPGSERPSRLPLGSVRVSRLKSLLAGGGDLVRHGTGFALVVADVLKREQAGEAAAGVLLLTQGRINLPDVAAERADAHVSLLGNLLASHLPTVSL